jgi:hypothetical protein
MTGNSTAGINQEVTGLTPGTSYQLTGWALSDTGSGSYTGAKGYDSSSGVSRAGNFPIGILFDRHCRSHASDI